jgi:hypothetical protein
MLWGVLLLAEAAGASALARDEAARPLQQVTALLASLPR